MFFNFTFRHFLTKPDQLAAQLQTSTMQGFRKRIVFVFLLSIALFATRNLWGMGTESLTPLLATSSTADFAIARYTSLFGAVSWAIIYVAFHFYGMAYILSSITNIQFKKLLPLQLLMVGLLLIEKALVFLVFVMKGEVANVSFLSLGPLASTFLENTFLIFFLNQLSIVTVLIVFFQNRYLRTITNDVDKKSFVFMLIAIQLVMALIIAAIGFIPFESLFARFIEGGVGIE